MSQESIQVTKRVTQKTYMDMSQEGKQVTRKTTRQMTQEFCKADEPRRQASNQEGI